MIFFQVLLISGGDSLEDSSTVSKYSAGYAILDFVID